MAVISSHERLVRVVALVAALICSLLIVYTNFRSLGFAVNVSRNFERSIAVEEGLNGVVVGFTRAMAAARLFLLSGNPADAATFDSLRGDSARLFDKFAANIGGSDLEKALPASDIDRLRSDISAKYDYLRDFMNQRSSISGLSSYDLRSRLFDPLFEVETEIDAWSAKVEALVHEQSLEMRRGGRLAIYLTVIGLLAVMGFVLGAVILIGKSLAESRRSAARLEIESKSLAAAERSKSDFLANMSHEIRTPMNAIMGFAELLKDGDAGARRAASYLDGIQTSGRLLLDLINDILDLSRLEAGRMPIDPEPVDTRSHLYELKLVFAPLLERKGLSFAIDIAPDLPEGLVLDAMRVRQILFNLIGNAVKFTHEGGVRVSVSYNGGKVEGHEGELRFEVADSGIGIPSEFIDRIFEPFRQVDGQSSRAYGGTGLGLAISRRLAEAMGGSLTVTSKEGRGATFALILPGVKATALSSPRDGAALPQMPLRFEPALVLVAEDDVFNRQVLRGFLDRSGLRIVEAENGKVALARMEQRKPDLVIMDLQMPAMDGPEAIKIIRSRPAWKDIPIVALSASTELDDRAKDVAALIDGYLRKPVTRVALRLELARHLSALPIEAIEAKDEKPAPIDSLSRFQAEIAGRGGMPEGLAAAFDKDVAGLLGEARRTFSIVMAEKAGLALEEFGERFGLESLSTIGAELAERAGAVDVEGMRRSFELAKRIGESLASEEGKA